MTARNNIKKAEDAARIFGDHEDITIKKVKQWCKQFGHRRDKLSLKILDNVMYCSGTDIRGMVETLLKKAYKSMALRSWRNFLFIPIGSPASSSPLLPHLKIYLK